MNSSLSGKFDVSAFRAGITGMSLAIVDTSLTAYGRHDGAVALSGNGPWNDEQVVLRAGKTEKSAKDTAYSCQQFIHAYTVPDPDKTP